MKTISILPTELANIKLLAKQAGENFIYQKAKRGKILITASIIFLNLIGY